MGNCVWQLVVEHRQGSREHLQADGFLGGNQVDGKFTHISFHQKECEFSGAVLWNNLAFIKICL